MACLIGVFVLALQMTAAAAIEEQLGFLTKDLAECLGSFEATCSCASGMTQAQEGDLSVVLYAHKWLV